VILTRWDDRLHGAGLYNDRYGSYRLEEVVQAQVVEDRACTYPEDFLSALTAAPRFGLDCRVLR
jgi:hypothetical protein